MRIWVARAGAGAAVAGLVTVVIGTFLPWSRSGSVRRDSYQSLGVLRELGFTDAFPLLAVFLDVWMAAVPAAAITIALYSLGFRRVSAVVAVIVAIIMGTVAGVVHVQGTDRGGLFGVTGTGPVLTLAGAVVTLLGAALVLATQRGRGRAPLPTRGGAP